ncbi:MAG: glycogen/starch synthase [Bacteroidia bacterium]
MYQAIHLSAECYPIAKTGGLGDVVGALPKYLNLAGIKTCVIMPRYNQKWHANNLTAPVFKGLLKGEHFTIDYFIKGAVDSDLGFDVFFVDIPELLFRENVYSYDDDAMRFNFFQQAALDWICTWKEKPEVLHCHDHHTGLIPFMVKHCYKFSSLNGVKTVFTIHNALYTGAFYWADSIYLPEFPYQSRGLLEWENVINPLACAIKCCNRLTTVSQGYLDELKFGSNPMQWLYNEFWEKSRGIVNGIDTAVWNPETDEYLDEKLSINWGDFKSKNKKAICDSVGIDPELPLVIFIGRLLNEKGGEILTQAVGQFVSQNKSMSFYVLGSGVAHLEDQLKHLTAIFGRNVANYIGYNEALAHKLYAAADFLIMPSLVEPCGLNQMYAMRYATIPIVRSVGGLKDTVVDFGDWEGYGIRFSNANAGDIIHSLYRAFELYHDKEKLNQVRERLIRLDFSWTKAVNHYIEIYKN